MTPNLTQKPEVAAFFDEATNTITYVVSDPATKAAAVIDSVMDIDYAAGRITSESADKVIAHIQEQGLKLEWIIETHVHADHLSAAPYIQEKLGGKTGIGARIMEVQETFGKIFNEGTEFQRDGSQFDALFEDGDTYQLGEMTGYAMATPGHTPACMVHVLVTPPLLGIHCSCLMADRQGPIFPVVTRVNFMTASKRYWRCRMRPVYLCAMIMARTAARSRGKPRWAMKKRRIFT